MTCAICNCSLSTTQDCIYCDHCLLWICPDCAADWAAVEDHCTECAMYRFERDHPMAARGLSERDF